MTQEVSNLSIQEQLKTFWDSVFRLSDDGLRKKPLNVFLRLLNIDCVSFKRLSSNSKILAVKKFSMIEFLHRNHLRILIPKLRASNKNFLASDLLQILEVLSNGIENDLMEFWSPEVEKISKQIWLPTKTDTKHLHPNSYKTSLKTTKSNSWFSFQTQKQELNSSLLTSVEQLSKYFPKKPIEKETVMRARKIKLDLSNEQKDIFRSWMGVSRYVYNECVSVFKQKKYTNKYDMRDKLVTNCEVDWQNKVPSSVREGSVFDACKGIKAGFDKFRKTGIMFDMSFRKKNEQSQTITISVDGLKREFKEKNVQEEPKKGKKKNVQIYVARKRARNEPNEYHLNIFPSYLGEFSRLKIAEEEKRNIHWVEKFIRAKKQIAKEGEKLEKKLKEGEEVVKDGERLENEVRIQMTRTGHWYLIVPFEKEVRVSENQWDVGILDPGVVTFMTGYSPNGTLFKIGDSGEIIKYLLMADKLHSKMYDKKLGIKGKKRYRHKIAWLKMLEKVRNRIMDCHRKSAKFLTDNFTTIILPPFEVKNMVRTGQRKIGRQTVRSMIVWSYYKFRMMLQSKCEELGITLICPSEAWTSKTCGNCGNVDRNLGSARTYSCKKCEIKIDRDINGSRNIFLRYLGNCIKTLEVSGGIVPRSE